MVNSTVYELFRKGSRTYFYSSVFFPKRVRAEVFILYGFVRKADNFVDAVPQDAEGFRHFRSLYEDSKKGRVTGDIVIDLFAHLMKKRRIKNEWVEAFLDSMEADISKHRYSTLDETEQYMYGSAEAVGLMMCALMGLPEKSHHYARLLGRAMQYINFIRDINEDIKLNRLYLPVEELNKFGLENLNEEHTSLKPEQFRKFMRRQIRQYCSWQKEAEKGFSYIPRLYLIPIKTAADMYYWTAKRIADDPFIVYKRKVKPSIVRIVWTIINNSVFLT